jgi:beta-glucosidase-like glycosyl hydrolase
MNWKKAAIKAALLCAFLVASAGCSAKTKETANVPESSERVLVSEDGKNTSISKESVDEIMLRLTTEQKAAQMVQGAVYSITEDDMKKYDYGSVLSTFGVPMEAREWRKIILGLQKSALESEAGIPYIFGNDAVHGVNTCAGTVIFPHNIGIGAANDEELTYQMGRAVADETRLVGVLWTFSPCIASAEDPRWGRTYESYSTEAELIKKMGSSFSKGLIDGGALPCAKHFLGDGNTIYGSGENSDGTYRLIDRGNAQLSEAEIQEQLDIYQAMIDSGVKTIMISHSSLNGVKMHENEKYIKMLKEEMGFDGFIVSDWNSIHNISGGNLKEQTIAAVNAGIDMLMEDTSYEECRKYIVEGVENGNIPKERFEDAVRRIISVKMELGIFDDPMMENQNTYKDQVGSEEYRELARTLVEESLVLLKNEKEILPLKKGTRIFVTGPAADDVGAQCGGWTISWQGKTDADNGGHKWVTEGKSILDGLMTLAEEYEFTLITDESQASQADVTLLCLGEKPYSEWEGDSEDISITGTLALAGNKKAIELADSLGLPTITLLVAGRNVMIQEYLDLWDAAVICYLPGSEGDGIANVLSGKKSFQGTLPMPYYSEISAIGTEEVLFPVGYGLQY